MKTSSVYDCSVLHLSRHHSDRKGNLTVVENQSTVPFDIKRVYYLYDVPAGASRGGHAHRDLTQLIVAVSGSFSVTVDDGRLKRTFVLNRPFEGLLIEPGMWRTISDFSSGAVCMVLSSEIYLESDYIRDYREFLLFKGISPDNED